MPRSRSFSQRTFAIALAASVVAGGVHAVAPAAHFPLSPGVAQAQEAGHISLADVEFVGLFDADGNKIDGPIRGGDTDATATGTVPGPGSYIQVKITNIGNAAPGDTVAITPQARFVLEPVSSDEQVHKATSLYFPTAQKDDPLNVNSTQVATLTTQAFGAATITFTDGVNNFNSGELTVNLPVKYGGRWSGDKGTAEQPKSQDFTGTWEVLADVNGAGTPQTIESREMTARYHRETPYIDKEGVYSDAGSYNVNLPEDGVSQPTVDIRYFEWRGPTGKDAQIFFAPSKKTDDTEWTFTGEQAKPTLRLWEFDPDNDNIRTRTVEAPEDVTMEATFVDGGWNVKIMGLKPNQKPIVYFKSDDPAIGTTDYVYGGKLGLQADYIELNDNDVPEGPLHDKSARLVELPKLPGWEGAGENVIPSAKATGVIDGVPAEANGVDAPARIAGQTKTFTFTVTNTSKAPITSVEVTDPAGKQTVQQLDTPLANGESTEVQVEFAVPANAVKLDFLVTAQDGALDVGPVSFLVDQSSKYQQNPDGSVTITDPSGNEVIVVSWDEYQKLVARVAELEGKQDVYVVEGVRNADNSITLTLNNGDKIVIPAANKAGLERCLNAPGGALLALLPVLGLLTAGLSQLNVEAINKSITDWQKQAGVYNEDAANFVAQNRGPLGALLGTLIGSIILFVPGLCGDVSLAGALKEAYGEGSSKQTEDEPSA